MKPDEILLAIQRTYPYSFEDVKMAFDNCGKSYDLLIIAIREAMVSNKSLRDIAIFMLERPLICEYYVFGNDRFSNHGSHKISNAFRTAIEAEHFMANMTGLYNHMHIMGRLK